VFSLGVVLYELLTGQRPFHGATLKDITEAVLHHEPPPAHMMNPAVPTALSDICAQAMAKNPDKRTRSARQLSRELRHWLDDHPDAVAEARSGKKLDDEGKPRRLLRWALGALAVAGIGAALWSLGETSGQQHAAAEAAAVAPPAQSPAPVATPAPVPDPAAEAAAVAEAAASAAAAAEAASAAAAAAAEAKPAAVATAPAAKPARKERKPVAAAPAQPAAFATGVVRIAVTPWGQVEVDGVPAGLTPPLNQVSLSEGRHEITVRNGDFPPFTATVNVSADQPASIRHRFGP